MTVVLVGLVALWALILLPPLVRAVRAAKEREALVESGERPPTLPHSALRSSGHLDDYEIAMLGHGRRLLVLVALLNLESAGALELPRKPLFSRLRRDAAKRIEKRGSSIVVLPGMAGSLTHPVEKAVYEAILDGSGSEVSLLAAAPVAAAVEGVERSLIDMGLVRSEVHLRELEREGRWLDPPPSRYTARGNSVLRTLSDQYRWELSPSVTTSIAVYGAARLWTLDVQLARALAHRRPYRSYPPTLRPPRRPSGPYD